MSAPFEITPYADQLAEIARWAYRCGWAPGTSTNYSVRLPADAAPAYCAITSSGIDKERLGAEHILTVDSTGQAVGGSPLTPSAETALHLMLYRSTHAGAVFHTHSMAATLLSQAAREEGRVLLSGWELLKGLEGITSHEHEVVLPVFPNWQNIPALASMIEPLLTTSSPSYGFLLAGHGLYVWGKDVSTAKRHLEVFEYLLQCEREARSHGHSSHTRPTVVPHE